MVILKTPLRRFLPAILLIGLVGSLGYAYWKVSTWPSSAFFLLPARGWEFLVGAGLALGFVRAPRSAAWSNILSTSGLALILGSVAFLNHDTPFPGLAALPACLGAGLILLGGSGGGSVVSSALATRPLVSIGLISYSLYLWHWPVLVLAKIWLQRPLGLIDGFAAIAVSVVLAWLTYRFVEQPWRGKAPKPQWKHLAFAAPLAAMVVIGLGIAWSGGLPFRATPAVLQADNAAEDINPLQGPCSIFGDETLPPPAGCRVGATAEDDGYDTIVWGDSHADSIIPGVAIWAQGRGIVVREASRGGCPPLLSPPDAVHTTLVGQRCAIFNAAVLKEIAENPRLKRVVLIARWPYYLRQPGIFFDEVGRFGPFEDGEHKPIDEVFNEGLSRTIAAIRQAHGPDVSILLMTSVPEVPFSPPTCVATMRLQGRAEERCHHVDAVRALRRDTVAREGMLAAARRDPRVKVASPASLLCDPSRCDTVRDGKILYIDHNHLSATAARMVVPELLSAFD